MLETLLERYHRSMQRVRYLAGKFHYESTPADIAMLIFIAF